MRDLHFVAGNFLFGDIPPDKEFLRFYYTSELERLFLSYHLLLGDLYAQEGFLAYYNLFRDHTGCLCSTRWLRKLLRRFRDIEEALAEAYRKPDLPMISRIKVGALFNPRLLQQAESHPR
jgi:hypothetical protein